MENMPKTLEELEDVLCIAHRRALRTVPHDDAGYVFSVHVQAATLVELRGHITGKELFSDDELMKAKIAGVLARSISPAWRNRDENTENHNR